ncbi:MAG: hypothetical protein WD066_19120, partial [Planctomycetaceae bacterium]
FDPSHPSTIRTTVVRIPAIALGLQYDEKRPCRVEMRTTIVTTLNHESDTIGIGGLQPIADENLMEQPPTWRRVPAGSRVFVQLSSAEIRPEVGIDIEVGGMRSVISLRGTRTLGIAHDSSPSWSGSQLPLLGIWMQDGRTVYRHQVVCRVSVGWRGRFAQRKPPSRATGASALR